MSAHRLPETLVAQMYADYQRLGSMVAAGKLHGRSAACLSELFKKRGLPLLAGLGERIAAKRRAKLDAKVAAMHARYCEGLSFSQVGREFGCTGGNVRDLFSCRGLATRPPSETAWRQHNPDGTWTPQREPTPEEIAAILAGMTRMVLPEELRIVWRRWPMDKRADFIARARAVVQPRFSRPDQPFSANVTPFDYATPEARQIADRLNAGRTSQTKAVQIRFGSQGVIWNGALWFWSGAPDAHHQGYVRGPWVAGHGRPELHRAIWEDANGTAVPARHVVRHLDGNPNNLDPSNLQCLPREQMLRENQASALMRHSRAVTALLLKQTQTPTPHARTLIAHRAA